MFSRVNTAALAACVFWATTVGAMEDMPAVPSGLSISLQEMLTDQMQDGTTALRLRFIAPEIGTNGVEYATVADDFLALCEEVGLPSVPKAEVMIDQIIVSFSDRATEFGVANPDATQYFEVFTLENDTCIWEAF